MPNTQEQSRMPVRRVRAQEVEEQIPLSAELEINHFLLRENPQGQEQKTTGEPPFCSVSFPVLLYSLWISISILSLTVLAAAGLKPDESLAIGAVGETV